MSQSPAGTSERTAPTSDSADIAAAPLDDASGRVALDDERVRAFVRSMPRSYRDVFDRTAIAAHAAIVERRGTNPTQVELWRELPERLAGVCVVADDCPGLLSRISAAFVAHDVDVVGAQAFCRRRPDAQIEAVDFFWVRRLSDTGGTLALRPADVADFAHALDTLVRGRANFDRAAQFARAVRAVGAATRVRFECDERAGQTVLTVEGPDRPGLLYAISEALFRERVQIVHSDVSTTAGRVLDRFTLTELDGAPVHRARLLGLQTTVLAAIEAEDSRRTKARRRLLGM
jgi:[protein-PII] uridylyltransferase